ncbi:MAG: aminotransferase class I/II-fold pyridoxal phosphate-dependent enzyme [Candidatus Kapabacteria bacterium]|nr:aminotransferase class I/II-fold pyridoxal phosphate-dependent enzyme [Candidatus Kapabacteria bacterium]
MKDIRNYKQETICVHAGTKESPEGSVVTPIYQTSTFKFKDVNHGASLFKGESDGYIYTRMRNPTIEAMEDAVAALECGAKALGCASGMAAIHTLFATVLSHGDHVICSEAVYGPTYTILHDFFTRFGVETTFVDTCNIEAVQKAVQSNTKLIFIETPGNPSVVMADIAAIALIAHKAGAKLAVDNTFMSPIYQKPILFGADYIVHSMTKYLNGHADVVAGIIILKDESEYKPFRKSLNLIGGVIDPFNSFLVHRGLKTLSIRVKQQAENAIIIAEYLENHPKVKWVNFPGLKSHPQYEIGLKQMTGPGSMIAAELHGGIEAGITVMNNIEIFQLAVSLGGVESLIQHPASMTHAGMGKESREQAHIYDGLIRISVGIEDVNDLLAALDKALELIA